MRFFEWWSTLHVAKDKPAWSRKLQVLGGPLSPAVAIAADWPRVGWLLVASLDSSWSAALPLERLGLVAADLVQLVAHATENEFETRDEPLWINIAPSADSQ
jgi:hypothetical protein